MEIQVKLKWSENIEKPFKTSANAVARLVFKIFEQVPGMLEALKDPNSAVSTIYTPEYCQKTWQNLQSFKGGEAIFTIPNCPIKCAGAPQKIAYLTDSYLTKVIL